MLPSISAVVVNATFRNCLENFTKLVPQCFMLPIEHNCWYCFVFLDFILYNGMVKFFSSLPNLAVRKCMYVLSIGRENLSCLNKQPGMRYCFSLSIRNAPGSIPSPVGMHVHLFVHPSILHFFWDSLFCTCTFPIRDSGQQIFSNVCMPVFYEGKRAAPTCRLALNTLALQQVALKLWTFA